MQRSVFVIIVMKLLGMHEPVKEQYSLAVKWPEQTCLCPITSAELKIAWDNFLTDLFNTDII